MLNLSDSERRSVVVTFDVNRFVATVGDFDGILIGKYYDKAALKADFKANGITGAKFDGIAQRKYGEVTA